jgi:hypothetical protein
MLRFKLNDYQYNKLQTYITRIYNSPILEQFVLKVCIVWNATYIDWHTDTSILSNTCTLTIPLIRFPKTDFPKGLGASGRRAGRGRDFGVAGPGYV